MHWRGINNATKCCQIMISIWKSLVKGNSVLVKGKSIFFPQIGWSNLLAQIAQQDAENFDCSSGENNEISTTEYTRLRIAGKNTHCIDVTLSVSC